MTRLNATDQAFDSSLAAVAVSWDRARILWARGSLDPARQLIEGRLGVSSYSQPNAFEESFVAGLRAGHRLRVTVS